MWEWERETFEWIAKSQSVNKMKSSSFFLLSACVCAMCHKKYMVWKVNALIEFACAPFNHTIKTPSVGKCHNIDAMTISLHLSTWILGTLFAIVVVNWIFYSNQSNICWNRSLVHRMCVCKKNHLCSTENLKCLCAFTTLTTTLKYSLDRKMLLLTPMRNQDEMWQIPMTIK